MRPPGPPTVEHLRARLGGSTPEIFCARHRAASCWAELGWWRRALIGFLSAWEFQPQRLESVYELSWRLRSRSDYQTAFALTARTVGQPQPEEDYVQPWVYQYALLFEHSINAYWVGEFKISIEACDRLLAMADLPETYRLDTVANRRYSVDALENARVVGRHGRLRHLTDAPMSQVLGEADPGLTGRLARLSGLLPDAIEQQFYCEGPEVEFPLREFNTALRLRPGTSDVRVVDATFYGSPHLPPPELTGLELIFDLGANIGTTAIHFASLFPEARIIAVELDLENAELCRRNTRGWGDRVVVVRGAVAAEDGMLSYNSGHQPWGRRLEEGGTDLVEAMSLDTLLALYARDRMVDYLKLDIEGAEEAVLREGGDWVRRVRCLKVETHGGYSVQQAMEHLESHGFVCQPTADHWSCVVGVRPPD